MDKSIDLDYLNNLLSELENKINELTSSQAKKYTNKEQKTEIEVKLRFDSISQIYSYLLYLHLFFQIYRETYSKKYNYVTTLNLKVFALKTR